MEWDPVAPEVDLCSTVVKLGHETRRRLAALPEGWTPARGVDGVIHEAQHGGAQAGGAQGGEAAAAAVASEESEDVGSDGDEFMP